METLAGVMGGVGSLIVVGWVIRTIVTNSRLKHMAKVQADMQARLLEKFGSSEEVLRYLQSPAGQRFVESATLERANPYGRILGSLQTGILLTLAGIALLYLSRTAILGSEGAEGFTLLGTLALALGIGFLISAALAHRLSKAWGLMGSGSRKPQEP